MPISVIWDDEAQTTIREIFEGRWDVPELEAATIQVYDMIETVDYPVDLMLDGSLSSYVPPNILSFAIKRMETRVHPRQQHLILVTISTFSKTMAQIGKKVMPKMTANLSIVATVAEGRARLSQLRAISMNNPGMKIGAQDSGDR